jgi:hypothetical protein
VKRWGKSPPPGWRHPGHGKPRVEQGQIGGEGWPSPYAFRSQGWTLRPSGRLLESRSDPGPRGMIAALHSMRPDVFLGGVGRSGQNPAYRLTRYYFLQTTPDFCAQSLRSLNSSVRSGAPSCGVTSVAIMSRFASSCGNGGRFEDFLGSELRGLELGCSMSRFCRLAIGWQDRRW